MHNESLLQSVREPEIPDPVLEVTTDNLNLPLALRRHRRPKKPRYILDL